MLLLVILQISFPFLFQIRIHFIKGLKTEKKEKTKRGIPETEDKWADEQKTGSTLFGSDAGFCCFCYELKITVHIPPLLSACLCQNSNIVS